MHGLDHRLLGRQEGQEPGVGPARAAALHLRQDPPHVEACGGRDGATAPVPRTNRAMERWQVAEFMEGSTSTVIIGCLTYLFLPPHPWVSPSAFRRWSYNRLMHSSQIGCFR